jgi:hypothetical protein
LFHCADYSSVFFIEQRYYSVNAFEIFVRRDGAQGELEKKKGFWSFQGFFSHPGGMSYYVVKAGLDRRRLSKRSTSLT